MQSDSGRSGTAEVVAVLRAAAARDSVLRNPDRFAERLISPWYRWGLRISLARAGLLWAAEQQAPGLYAYVTARTKYFDQVIVGEIRSGAEQVVILGAGADSRAQRLPELRSVAVYELDHPATAEWKQRRLRAAFGAVPAQVRYVPVDFGNQSLDDVLDAAEVARDRRTIFLWEGVAPYLTHPEVDVTLTAIARFRAGSSVVFDYWDQGAIDEPSRYPGAAEYLRRLAARGEPIRSGLDPNALADHLTAHGLKLVDNAGPRELAEYLTGSGRSSLSFCWMAHARVR
ncbi:MULTISPECIES: SAM-dependent methyltransferase [unclassified Nocardia]|uniref:class I SAM-dependent methyltransferase n=1 Tax=unclassified Nocardia TaxID=2637762 RepID=UPI001CE4312D|nr:MULTISPECIES: SAM-dependent methyltransferase [unclassified Nocardia]